MLLGRPWCPFCGARFDTETQLQQHVKQPFSKCAASRDGGGEGSSSIEAQTTSPAAPSIHTKTRSNIPEPNHEDNSDNSEGSDSDSMDIDDSEGANDANPDDVQMDDHWSDALPAPDAVDVPLRSSPEVLSPLKEDQFGRFLEEYPKPSLTFGRGATFMDKFHADIHSSERAQLPWYPFRSEDEWKLASFLLQSKLSQAETQEFLDLEIIKKLDLSFRTAKDLQSRVEILPSGPQWKSVVRPSRPGFPTKKPVTLFYRDPIECIQDLLQRPTASPFIKLEPYRLWSTADQTKRIFTEWLSGERAWEMQDKLPAGATLLGTVLSTDKTSISVMTGGRSAYPLFLTLANFTPEFRSKSSNDAYLLVALLPIAKFLHPDKDVLTLLENRLFHECLDFVLKPLKLAAEFGKMMSDPQGYSRFCFTPIASCVVDTPESALVAGVGGKTSSVTTASHHTFGDAFRHDSRTGATTLTQLSQLAKMADPWEDVAAYQKLARKKYRLNGVHEPFWRDWPLAEPSIFLTPEPLHHWHIMFWDHDGKWCINVVGSQEIDFRFSILPYHVGFRQFKEGISQLKQVTGREHREMQRYIIPVIADAVPKDFVIAVRSLLDFRYLGQAHEIDEGAADRISEALGRFHSHKSSVIRSGGRRGKKKIINHWKIQKLEFMQSVVPNIRKNGVPTQWSADVTEHAHIVAIKNPARASNNHGYEAQICRHLDRVDKCNRFELAMSMREDKSSGCASSTLLAGDPSHSQQPAVDAETENFDHQAHGPCPLKEHAPSIRDSTDASLDYFLLAEKILKQLASGSSRRPCLLRTFSTTSTAFHLSRDPSVGRTDASAISMSFRLPDFTPALHEYVNRIRSSENLEVGGRRRNQQTSDLPFEFIEVWKSFRIQGKGYHPPHLTLPARTINAHPLIENEWPEGKSDAALLNVDPSSKWPLSGLEGHQVVEVKVIFRIVSAETFNLPDHFLAYVQRFDIIPQLNRLYSNRAGPYPEPSTSLYLLKRALRADKTPIGDIVPLSRLRSHLNLVPRFGAKADQRLTSATSLAYSNEFWLNSYFEKELYYALNT